MKRWIFFLIIFFIFTFNAYADEEPIIPNPKPTFEEIAISYDYGSQSPLGQNHYGSWVLDYHDYLLEGIYSVGEEDRETILTNWSRMREYWLRYEPRIVSSSDDVISYSYYYKNGDDLKIWCSMQSGEVAYANGGYGDSTPQPVYEVMFLLVDPMEQTDEEILERLKAMEMGYQVTYLTADGQEHTEEFPMNMEGLHREIHNEEGVSFVVETCEIRLHETYEYFLPEEVQEDATLHPEKYARLILSVKMNKNMPYHVYKLQFGAFEDKSIWSNSSAASEDFDWGSTELGIDHIVKNGEHSLRLSGVVKLDEVTEATVLQKLKESSWAAYYSTEGVGNLFGEGAGSMRYGPVFETKLDFSSVVCFFADSQIDPPPPSPSWNVSDWFVD